MVKATLRLHVCAARAERTSVVQSMAAPDRLPALP